MTRQWKVTVAGALMAFAIAAPSTASAAEFHSTVSPVTFVGTSLGSHVLTTGVEVTCKTVHYHGQFLGKTQNVLTVTIKSPTPCTTFGLIHTTIDYNGCGYLIHATGTTEIECPSGKQIEVTEPGCTTKIGPQHLGGGNAFLNNAGKTDFTATANISGIDYDECGTAGTNGVYKGSTTFLSASASIWYE